MSPVRPPAAEGHLPVPSADTAPRGADTRQSVGYPAAFPGSPNAEGRGHRRSENRDQVRQGDRSVRRAAASHVLVASVGKHLGKTPRSPVARALPQGQGGHVGGHRDSYGSGHAMAPWPPGLLAAAGRPALSGCKAAPHLPEDGLPHLSSLLPLSKPSGKPSVPGTSL